MLEILDRNMDVSCSPNSGTNFPLGTIPITCTSSDYSFNTSYITFDVTVVDTTPPVFSPVENITSGTSLDSKQVQFSKPA